MCLSLCSSLSFCLVLSPSLSLPLLFSLSVLLFCQFCTLTCACACTLPTLIFSHMHARAHTLPTLIFARTLSLLIFSHTRVHVHTLPLLSHSLTHAHTLPLLTFSLSQTHSLPLLSYSLSHACSHSLTLKSHTFSPYFLLLFHSFSPSPPLSLPCLLSLTLSFACSLSQMSHILSPYSFTLSVSLVIEKFTENTRFCLICNYLSKIIPALQSRCTRFRFGPLSQTQMIPRLEHVIQQER